MTVPVPEPDAMSLHDAVPRPRAIAVASAFEARLHPTLATVAPAWRALEAEGVSSAYQRLDWVEQLVLHVAASARATPLFVEVRDGATERPVLILPLAPVRRRTHRVITWMDLGLCDYAAPVMAPGIALDAVAAAAAWTAVRAVLPRADLIHIVQIPEAVQGVVNPLSALAGCRPMALTASGIAIAGAAETLLGRLCRPGTVRDLGKQRRRLDRAGTVAFVEARTPGEVSAIFSALVEQRRRRFAAMGRFDLLARPEVETFYREAALQSLRGGAVRLFGLSVSGAWIAAAYGLVHRDTFHGILLTTSDADAWRNASPGLQVVAECLGWARRHGVTYFDFTVGDLPYKRDFGVEIRPLWDFVQPLTARGHVVERVRGAADSGQAWLRRHPALFERLRTVRRRLRRAGAP